MRVLLSDGSGLTSRQTAGLLAARGHDVGVLCPDPLAITTWTNAVSTRHRTPRFGIDPRAWLDAARRHALAGGYDVLLPTQEQVSVLSWARDRGVWPEHIVLPVPPFAALRRVQDKLAAAATLAGLGLPRPAREVLRSLHGAATWDRYPAYVKTPIGTASSGVRRLDEPADLRQVIETPPFADALATSGVLLEEAIPGALAMVCGVVDRGRLVAFHATRRVGLGAGGGASHKLGIALPAARAQLAAIGERLEWHGALSADVIVPEAGPPVIVDVNPRLVEPANAACCGVDLVTALLDVATGAHPVTQPDSRADVRTHQLLLAVLGAAEQERSRRAVWAEALRALTRLGPYRGSVEELTPLRGDPRSAVPCAAALALTSIRPSLGRLLASTSTGGYALSPAGWAALVAASGA